MSDLGPRTSEPPIGADLGVWAAGEVTKHEEICGLRYQRIDERMERIEKGGAEGLARIEKAVEAINNRYKDGVKYVLGLMASLGVALVLMFLNSAKERANADESDKREMRARLSLLTQQLANTAPRAVVVAPAGSQTTPIPSNAPALDPDDLNAAVSGKQRQPGG